MALGGGDDGKGYGFQNAEISGMDKTALEAEHKKRKKRINRDSSAKGTETHIYISCTFELQLLDHSQSVQENRSVSIQRPIDISHKFRDFA